MEKRVVSKSTLYSRTHTSFELQALSPHSSSEQRLTLYKGITVVVEGIRANKTFNKRALKPTSRVEVTFSAGTLSYRSEADLGVRVQSECHRGVAVQGGVDVVQDLNIA